MLIPIKLLVKEISFFTAPPDLPSFNRSRPVLSNRTKQPTHLKYEIGTGNLTIMGGVKQRKVFKKKNHENMVLLRVID